MHDRYVRSQPTTGYYVLYQSPHPFYVHQVSVIAVMTARGSDVLWLYDHQRGLVGQQSNWKARVLPAVMSLEAERT